MSLITTLIPFLTLDKMSLHVDGLLLTHTSSSLPLCFVQLVHKHVQRVLESECRPDNTRQSLLSQLPTSSGVIRPFLWKDEPFTEDMLLYPPPFGFRGLQTKVEELLKLVNAALFFSWPCSIWSIYLTGTLFMHILLVMCFKKKNCMQISSNCTSQLAQILHMITGNFLCSCQPLTLHPSQIRLQINVTVVWSWEMEAFSKAWSWAHWLTVSTPLSG